jgi:membrane protein DedA with SNARE-associated domain
MSAIVTRLGPLGVFLLMVPESACIPVPSELTLLAAGFAVHQGWMAYWVAVASATAGNLVGSLIAYGLGRLTSGWNARAGAAVGLARGEALLFGHGARAVFIARLLPLARTFVSLPAGHARIRLGPFVMMTALGCSAWAGVFVFVGMAVGSGSKSIGDAVGLPLLAVGLAAIAIALRTPGGRKR